MTRTLTAWPPSSPNARAGAHGRTMGRVVAGLPRPALQERTLTELDHARLMRLLLREAAAARGPGLAELSATLHQADLVPPRAVAPDVVTMYSRVLLEEPASGRRHQITLCYPADAEPAEGFVSVLSPVGASLLGLRVGSVAHWHTPGGGSVQAEVVALLFQPESSGDFTL